jgi:very-short-patch-repair endonuclease
LYEPCGVSGSESFLGEYKEAGSKGQQKRPAKSGRLRKLRSDQQPLTQVARTFRKVPTASENLLWQQLRRGQLQGYVFRRQHPIDLFVVDFCCPVRSLIVEIDGPVHAGQGDADAERQRQLEARGYRLFRVTAHEVETRMAAVLQAISESLDSL